MRNKLFYIILAIVVLLIQLGGSFFLKIDNAAINFLIIFLFLANFFYGQNYKINLVTTLIFGFILDIFSILPFGFWMVVFFLFFSLSYVFINYLLNKDFFLNIIWAILFTMASYEVIKLGFFKIFYILDLIIISRVDLIGSLKELIYNSLLTLLLYLLIKKIIQKVAKYESYKPILEI